MFPRNENRNEGTCAKKPPFYETALLSPGEGQELLGKTQAISGKVKHVEMDELEDFEGMTKHFQKCPQARSSRIRFPEGPARHPNASRQELTLHCLAIIVFGDDEPKCSKCYDRKAKIAQIFHKSSFLGLLNKSSFDPTIRSIWKTEIGLTPQKLSLMLVFLGSKLDLFVVMLCKEPE